MSNTITKRLLTSRHTSRPNYRRTINSPPFRGNITHVIIIRVRQITINQSLHRRFSILINSTFLRQPRRPRLRVLSSSHSTQLIIRRRNESLITTTPRVGYRPFTRRAGAYPNRRSEVLHSTQNTNRHEHPVTDINAAPYTRIRSTDHTKSKHSASPPEYSTTDPPIAGERSVPYTATPTVSIPVPSPVTDSHTT